VPARRPIRARKETLKHTVSNKNSSPQSHASPKKVDDDLAVPSFDDALKENVPPTLATPSATRFKDVLQESLPSTPRHRVRLGAKLITPRSYRVASQSRPQNVYAAARQLFAQAGTTARIIGRDGERETLQSFVHEGVASQHGGCLYVSGPPGTGKSALVHEVLRGFEATSNVKISKVNCVTNNTMVQITNQLSEDLSISIPFGKSAKPALAKLFTSGEADVAYVVLMDEIDSLLDGDGDLLDSMFEWALHPSSNLLLIGIANALDLTDRFMPRLKSRNLKPQLLPFLPYTASDMAGVITTKLQCMLPPSTEASTGYVPIIHPAAIKLIGSKIAAQTGDLRKAFNLTRRTIDLIEREAISLSTETARPTKEPFGEVTNNAGSIMPSPIRSESSPLKIEECRTPLTAASAPRATIKHVAKLASSIFNNGAISRLAGLNLQQKAVLCSLVSRERRQEGRDPFKTPSKSSKRVPTVKDLFEKYGQLCQRDDGLMPVLKNTEFRDVVASLETLGLIQEAVGRSVSMLTPSKTPSKLGRSIDERQFKSVVSENELRDSMAGPGADLLQRLLDE
jgi:cell division control protein 6